MYYFLACKYSAKYSCHVKLQDELNFMFSYYFLIYVFWIQASATDEAIALLLFEWAVSKYRVGKFRALAVAKTLQRRQAEILDEVRHTVHVHTIVMSKYATECNITEGQYFEFTKLCSACSFYKPFETIFLLKFSRERVLVIKEMKGHHQILCLLAQCHLSKRFSWIFWTIMLL